MQHDDGRKWAVAFGYGQKGGDGRAAVVVDLRCVGDRLHPPAAGEAVPRDRTGQKENQDQNQ